MKHFLTTCKLLFFLLLITILNSCTQKIYPPTEDYAHLYVDKKFMQVNVGPYINAMPGAQSNDVITPITFYLENAKQGEKWPRKFKIVKIKVSGVSKNYYHIKKLNHNLWMHNTAEENDRNGLRIPIKVMPSSFDITIWLKDDKGKRYRIKFHGLGAGKVY